MRSVFKPLAQSDFVLVDAAVHFAFAVLPIGLAAILLATPVYAAEVKAAEKALEKTTGKIGYNQFIRPILSDNCSYCHGPDKNHRQAELRLDVRDVAVAKGAPSFLASRARANWSSASSAPAATS